MSCEKCPSCGMVLDNHDYDMAMNCTRGLGVSPYEMAMEFIEKRIKK